MTEARDAIGRVVRTDAKVCHVEVEGAIVQCAPRGKLFEEHAKQKNPIAVGDFVRVDLGSQPASLEEVLTRRNWLGRVASSHDPREQVMVANVDRLYIVDALAKPKFSSIRTDRILAGCFWHDIPATLVLNKTDLDRTGEAAAIRATYEAIGVDVLETCALQGLGIEELREHGFRQVRAATRGGAAPSEFDWSGRIALWVGSETGALPEDCAPFEQVTIPMKGAVESLNVTVAASLLLFAAGRSEERGS